MPSSHSDKPFHIFGLSLFHHMSSIKIGTDAVLISSAIRRYTHASRVLDVGCGCGIIGLSYIQHHTDAQLTGIDIHPPSVQEATHNALGNHLENRASFICIDYLKFEPHDKFDLIVSNPPYFHNQLKSPEAVKNRARHNDSGIPYDLFVKKSAELSSGTLAVIIPLAYTQYVKDLANTNGFFLTREIYIYSKPSAQEPIRMILFFSNTATNPSYTISQKLTIRNTDLTFTDEYLEFVYQS